MNKSYWQQVWPFLAFSVFMLGIFALLFFLFDLDFTVYRLGCGIMLFVLGIILVVRALTWRHEASIATELTWTKKELKHQQAQQHQDEQELHDYFLLWVHQMKTPITASALLINEMESSEGDALRLELTQIERYTNMALTYLKLKSPASDLHIQPTPLDHLIKPLIHRYRLSFIHQNIRLHYEPIPDQVVTDANWSQLMIEQIINNAIKYAPQAEVWIAFDPKTYRLIIRDSGTGIQASDLPKIFDKGYSGFNGELTQKASGIGLFLVKKIADRLNQPVNVTSSWGEGTTFTIQFHAKDPLFKF
ncbi:MAG: sensor histidine kinase [Aerococcus sp.]|nr:sensor histidine kinase [Aerococcus sp.]